MLVDVQRARPTSENDSTKDDLAGDACIDQSRLVRRGSGAAGNRQTGSSIELLRRGPPGGHQEDVGAFNEAGQSVNVSQIVADHLVLAAPTRATRHRQLVADAEASL